MDATVATSTVTASYVSALPTNNTILNTATTTAPLEVIISGNNPQTIDIGTVWGDLGAVASSTSVYLTNFGITTFVDGVQTLTPAIDTSVAGTHSIIYKVINAQTNTMIAEAIRIVNVVDPSAPVATPIAGGTVTNSTLTDTVSVNSSVVDTTTASSTIVSSTVTGSAVEDSTLTGTVLDTATTTDSVITGGTITDSTVATSTIVTSTITLSDIATSTISNSTLASTTVATSTVINSTISDSILVDVVVATSTITSSNVSGGSIASSTLNSVQSTGMGASIIDSVINNTTLTDAVITSNVMTSGSILLPDGTTTETIVVATPLTDLVNYAPVASFIATVNNLVATVTDTSSDQNNGTSAYFTDLWNYMWNFGDGVTTPVSVATVGNSQTHTYSTAGAYTISLLLTDKYGLSSTANSSVTAVSIPTVVATSNGGGGGGWSPFVQTVLKAVVGDTNKDGRVDKYDFALLMAEWGKGIIGSVADFNKDGKVNKYDFALLMAAWAK